MQKLTADDPETKSADLTAQNVEQLKTIFPEAFTEGRVDFEVLKQLLGGVVEDREEKYGLNWHGKRQARQLALTPSSGTLRPCPDESLEWDKTGNLVIEGDNLEVLKLLQKSYSSKVKMIYIDPPYNTGSDFVYPDDFRDSIKNYLEITGQTEDGRKISSNTDASGRYHTDWLNMIYPRLKLAHCLLNNDGVIFASIDDNEIANLRAVMDSVFGEENFVATVIWQKVFSPKNTARHFSEDHDYIVIYAKNADIWSPELLPRSEDMEARYTNNDEDTRGAWTSSDLCARNYYSQGTYSVTCPSGRVISGPPSGTYWRVSLEKFKQLDADGRIYWGADGNNMPRLKRYLSDVKAGVVPQTLWKYQDVGHTQEAKKELLSRVKFASSDSVFDTPKPTRLIERMLRLATTNNSDDIVLDFFAGSGTTGDAVFKLNFEDGGNRRFILVQLPEPTGQPDYPNLAQVTRERLLQASKELNAQSTLFHTDLGFRVFKFDSSNIRAWEPNRTNIAESLEDYASNLKTDRSALDILFELLLKLGLDLTVPIEEITIAGKTVYAVGAGVLLVCLATSILASEVEALGTGIASWQKELAPVGETQVVFRDSAFADDVAKTNMTAILQQQGLDNVRSL